MQLLSAGAHGARAAQRERAVGGTRVGPKADRSTGHGPAGRGSHQARDAHPLRTRHREQRRVACVSSASAIPRSVAEAAGSGWCTADADAADAHLAQQDRNGLLTHCPLPSLWQKDRRVHVGPMLYVPRCHCDALTADANAFIALLAPSERCGELHQKARRLLYK